MQQLLSSGFAEQTINKSRFIASADYADTERAVAASLRKLALQHANASHLAYAFRIKTPQGIIQRFSDAGEPSGTAGKPILQFLEGRDLINVCVGVIRYYGGINLGTGGLARAYSGTAKMALENTKIGQFVEQENYIVQLEYKQLDYFKRDLHNIGGEILQSDFGERVQLLVRAPKEKWSPLATKYT